MIKRRKILLIEDNPGDVRLTFEAIKDAKLDVDIQVITDSEKAIEHLLTEKQSGNFKPDLILLDLNMPKKSGHDLLIDLKSNPSLKRIPVIAITTSEAEYDIFRAYDNGANAYVQKPVDFDDFSKVMKHIFQFWFELANLPNE